MDFETKYRQAYERLHQAIETRKERGQLTAMGFTSNLDLLCDFDIKRFNELIGEYLADKSLADCRRADLIRDEKELLETILYFCSRGIGGEVDVENTELVRRLFDFHSGMGGTATQAALALSALGGESLVHLTDDSGEVCELLDTPHVYVALEGGGLGHADQLVQSRDQEIHFIIQFRKGDRICLGEEGLEIPVSNRLILTHTTVNETVPFWPPYFQWIEEHADRVTSHVLSSFNCVQDKEVLESRLDFVRRHILAYHERNPGGIAYFEDAHYHNVEIRRLLLENIYPYVDIVGMNEEELRFTLDQMYGFAIDPEDILSCLRGVDYLLSKFRIRKGIVVHTKDYSMYVGEGLDCDIESGLMFGNMMATAKAVSGSYGGPDQVREVLELEMSKRGLEARRIVGESAGRDRVVLVPSKYVDKPKFTIGLGDSFVGGLQMCF